MQLPAFAVIRRQLPATDGNKLSVIYNLTEPTIVLTIKIIFSVVVKFECFV